MKKVMFFLAATLVFMATGCNKENTVTDDVQYVSELKVNFEGDTKGVYVISSWSFDEKTE